ncbi:MAG: hypothetical protein WD768_01295 [Phycisphaeraceae bacterium]
MPTLKSVMLLIAMLGCTACKPAADKPVVEPVNVNTLKEGKHVDGPLRPNGLVDYVQAYEAYWGKGVTSENNAAPLLIRAYGASFHNEQKLFDAVCRKLKIEPPPARGDYIVRLSTLCDAVWDRAELAKDERFAPNIDTWLKQVPAEVIAAARKTSETQAAYIEAVEEELELAGSRPWKAEDHPLLHAWLALNEEPLKLVKQASGYERYYMPSPHEPDETVMMGMLLAALGKHRDVGKALCARAMLRLSSGDRDGACDDLLTLFRFASLLSEEPLLIAGLVAISLDSLAIEAMLPLVVEGGYSQAELKKMLGDLNGVSPRKSMLPAIDVTERFSALDALSVVRRQGVDAMYDMFAAHPRNTAQVSDDELKEFNALLDVNVTLREINRWFDGITAAMSAPTHIGRVKAEEAWFEKYKAMKSEAAKLMPADDQGYTRSLMKRAMREPAEKRREVMSRDLANLAVAFLVPSLGSAISNDDTARTRLDLARLTLALTAYRAQHGSYPAALAELSPDYLARIPHDRFTEKPLRYTPEKDGFLLYSLGTNMQDEGGAYSATVEKYFADIAVRVKDGKFVPREAP